MRAAVVPGVCRLDEQPRAHAAAQVQGERVDLTVDRLGRRRLERHRRTAAHGQRLESQGLDFAGLAAQGIALALDTRAVENVHRTVGPPHHPQRGPCPDGKRLARCGQRHPLASLGVPARLHPLARIEPHDPFGLDRRDRSVLGHLGLRLRVGALGRRGVLRGGLARTAIASAREQQEEWPPLHGERLSGTQNTPCSDAPGAARASTWRSTAGSSMSGGA